MSTIRTPFDGHVMYASGHPCPMCLAAMYLVGIPQVSLRRADQALSMQAMRLEHRPVRPAGLDLYEAWKRLNHGQLKE